MYLGQKVVVVLPAYRAALTLKQTIDEIRTVQVANRTCYYCPTDQPR